MNFFFKISFKSIELTLSWIKNFFNTFYFRKSFDCFNITQWTEMPSGGHFAALEEPELLVNDLVKFSRTVR